MNAKTKVLKGYKEKFKTVDKKKYSFSKAIKQYKRTGYFKTRSNGSGHDAGYRWAQKKGIDPESRVQRYSKNSPSFDEGVYGYKESVRSKALNKLKN